MNDVITSLRLFMLSVVVCCIAYPAAILGFAAVAAPEQRAGSLIRDDAGAVIGSRLIAQSFTRPEYFWPRPSAVDYNASATGGSNLSPTNPLLTERAAGIIDRLHAAAGDGELEAPADLVAASGSGLDPHITAAAALFQVPRVAQARGLSAEVVRTLVHQYADSTTLAAFGGEPLVNVLELNIALDNLQ